ncbi:hypothetical protein, partial [Mycobacterium paragordonae]|uniref:hypothetical protein n=1 Tax=Mycobacterium paragordonae TaxID=1389713 RepID=UPI003987BB02
VTPDIDSDKAASSMMVTSAAAGGDAGEREWPGGGLRNRTRRVRSVATDEDLAQSDFTDTRA